MNPNIYSMNALFSASLRSAACVLAVASCSSLSAMVTLIDNNGASESWNTAADWSNNQPVTTNEDYDTNGFNLRSPNTPTWSSSFPSGSTLTVQDSATNTGGALIIKSGTMDMGTVYLGLGGVITANANNGSNVPSTFNATRFEVLSTSIQSDPGVLRGSFTGNNLTMNFGELAGSGYLELGASSNINYSLNVADGSGFTGVFDFVAGNLTLDSGVAMSSGSFIMSNGSSTMDFGSNILTVGSFAFGGTSLLADTYSSSELNTLLSTDVFSGSGSLVVVPEPSTVAVLMGAGVMLFAFRRRSAKRA